jgi:uncharacterized protein (DUF433 family)
MKIILEKFDYKYTEDNSLKEYPFITIKDIRASEDITTSLLYDNKILA